MAHQVAELRTKPIRPAPLMIPPSNVGYRLLRRMGWADSAIVDDEDDRGSITDHLQNSDVSKINLELPSSAGGLGSRGQGRRFPVATVLKRDRLGLGISSTKKVAKVTHFPAHDIAAVHTVFRSDRGSKSVKLDRRLQANNVKRDKAREKRIRDQLNLNDEQLSIMYAQN
ncbi:hypothetical protein CRM22_009436 [Opisthorchis felineus]|uniref:G-patch domain-containing protein n=1 Tax=Opisthorchis felineus TaxID=147828 RepID=A0A4S2L6Z9_OPIFE|nr:hypothetical protein CRM22_009436 [Opisthorchis felineus]